MPPKARPIPERFWPKVDKTGECWVWKAAKTRAGYGVFHVGGSGISAHRVAYELMVGPIPDGLQLDHLCENTSCVNPDHLVPVTARENVHRSQKSPAAQNMRKAHCSNGHPFSGENLVISCGRRQCRICKRESFRRWYRRHRAI